MTIFESLQSDTLYPVPDNAIEKFCIVRGLVSSDEFDGTIAISEGYQLAQADAWYWLYTAFNVSEQQVSFSVVEADNFLYKANLIYAEYEDPNFSGQTFGFIGEDLNG